MKITQKAMNESYFDKIVTYKDFCKAHNIFPRIAPQTFEEYLSYKFWALSSGNTAYGAENPNERQAFETASRQFIAEEIQAFEKLLDSS